MLTVSQELGVPDL